MKKTAFLSFLFILTICALLTSAVRAETRYERPIAPGAQFVEMHRSLPDGKPLSIYAVRIDRTARNLSFRAMKGDDHVIGTASPRTMGEGITRKNAEVIATINGDFYCMDNPLAGLPCGMIIRNGELMCSPMGWPAIGFDSDGNPKVAVAALIGNMRAGTKSFQISMVNRPRESANDLSLFTPTFGARTFANKPSTNVVLSDIMPKLPLRPGITYTGKVRTVRKDVTVDDIPADAVLLSGGGSAAEFLADNAAVGSTISFSVGFDSEWNQMTQALGGWPILLHNGQLQTIAPDEYLTKPRHSRSAIGWNERYIYVVAIDRSDDESSAGMNMAELAAFMQELGCTEAMNMDGGGSTALAIRGDVVNHPSDGLDRMVSNGWAVMNSARAGAPGSIRVWPDNVSVLAGSKAQFRVLAADSAGSPVQVNPQDVKWSLEGIEASSSAADPDSRRKSAESAGQVKGTLGRINGSGQFTAANIFRHGKIAASVGTLSAASYVNIWDKPAALCVVPAQQVIKPGQRLQYSVLATDRAGNPMIVDPSLVRWSTAGGSITANGMLSAPRSGRVTVTATVEGVRATSESKVR